MMQANPGDEWGELMGHDILGILVVNTAIAALARILGRFKAPSPTGRA
jgi:hypothetical protein